MRPRCLAVAGCALVLALPGAATATTTAASNPYLHEQGLSNPLNDQGSNPDYRSYITSVTPAAHGLGLLILRFADGLQLTNRTGRTVVIYGYQGEPYARVLANGTVQLNVRSPAVYLNTNYYGTVAVPPSADPQAAPQWATAYSTGVFEWHDHRIHWPSPILPKQVTNKSKRTFITNWTVPITVGAQRGTIAGQLFWVPQSSSSGSGPIIALAIVLVLAIALVLFVRRRRARGGGADGGADGGAPLEPQPAREAW